MTTVLAVYDCTRCIGRCDVRCHGARNAACHCICGGKNHGVGSEIAEQNTRALVGLTDEDLRKFAEASKLDPANLKVIDRTAIPNARQARRAARRALIEPELPWSK